MRVSLCVLFCTATLPLVGLAEDAPTFEKDVRPILEAKCVGCHGGDEPRQGLDVRSREGLLRGGRSGSAVEPGSLRDSLIWGFVATDKMPAEGEKLTNDEKDVLRRWLVAGAPDATHLSRFADRTVAPQPTKHGLAATVSTIDRLVAERLREENVPAADRCDDATFLRRVFLDLTGTVPDFERTVAFLDDTRPDKRARLIDELLDSPEFGRRMAVLWHQLLVPKSSGAYRRIPHDKFKAWLAESFEQGRGWDAVVTDLLTAEGYLPSEKDNEITRKKALKQQPQNVATAFVNVHNVEGRPQPKGIVASASRLFLAQSIECAQCHNHPLAKWRSDDFWAAAAFFERVRYEKAVYSETQIGRLSEPVQGKPLEYRDDKAARYAFVPGVYGEPVIDMEDPGGKRTGTMIRARFLDGVEPEMNAQQSYRAVFAEWVTSPENPYFARAFVNRVWSQLLGRGFVEPVDDMSEDNPVSHPELLDALAAEFAGNDFDVKHLVRSVCNSETYQRSSVPAATERAPSKLFAQQSPRQLSEHQLVEALTVVVPTFADTLAEDREDKNPGRLLNEFLETYAAGDGPTTDYTRGLQQALRMMNGDGRLFHHAAVAKRVSEAASVEENVEAVYLQVLNRRPTPAETERMAAFVRRAEEAWAGLSEKERKRYAPTEKNPRQSPYSDVLWVLVNSGEFAFNH